MEDRGKLGCTAQTAGYIQNVTLNALYDQLEELNENIRNREEGSRYPNAKEADTLIKLTASIRNLETDLAIADISMSGVRFIKFIQYRVPVEKVTEIADYWNDFYRNKLRRMAKSLLSIIHAPINRRWQNGKNS